MDTCTETWQVSGRCTADKQSPHVFPWIVECGLGFYDDGVWLTDTTRCVASMCVCCQCIHGPVSGGPSTGEIKSRLQTADEKPFFKIIFIALLLPQLVCREVKRKEIFKRKGRARANKAPVERLKKRPGAQEACSAPRTHADTPTKKPAGQQIYTAPLRCIFKRSPVRPTHCWSCARLHSVGNRRENMGKMDRQLARSVLLACMFQHVHARACVISHHRGFYSLLISLSCLYRLLLSLSYGGSER